jgi:hypothetical protein
MGDGKRPGHCVLVIGLDFGQEPPTQTVPCCPHVAPFKPVGSAPTRLSRDVRATKPHEPEALQYHTTFNNQFERRFSSRFSS